MRPEERSGSVYSPEFMFDPGDPVRDQSEIIACAFD